MNLPELILLSRKRSKLTQGEVAEKLNSNRATVSCWETDARHPSLENFARLRKVFQWSNNTVADVLEGLCGGKDDPT